MSMTKTQRIARIKLAMLEGTANLIREEVKRRKITQTQFAKFVGMYPQAVSRLLSGAQKSIHQGTMIRIYVALGFVPTILKVKAK